MTLHSAPPPPDEGEDLDLPEAWSDSARETFEAVYDERPTMTATEVAALWQACALESAADHLDGIAGAACFVATGSQGQEVVHPAVAEARMARTQAATILARLVPASAGGAMTNSTRGRMARPCPMGRGPVSAKSRRRSRPASTPGAIVAPHLPAFDPAVYLGRVPLGRDDYLEAARLYAADHTDPDKPTGALAWAAYATTPAYAEGVADLHARLGSQKA